MNNSSSNIRILNNIPIYFRLVECFMDLSYIIFAVSLLISFGSHLRYLDLIFLVQWLRALLSFPRSELPDFVSQLINEIQSAVPPLNQTHKPYNKQYSNKYHPRIQQCFLALTFLRNIQLDRQRTRDLTVAIKEGFGAVITVTHI